jgi:1-deoxy-D-xylulose-5-phosphate synthase
VLVHVITTKGFGYPLAEENEEDCLHQVAPTGAAVPSDAIPPAGAAGAGPQRAMTQVFGDELAAIGARRPDVVAITAAMLHPTGLSKFAAAFPDRVFDVGIAEQHAVTSAAGLAMGGLHPVVALYATFLNRAFDQVLMDVALHRLPVTFVLDRAGVTGPDGASHHGMWDGSIMQVVPGMRVAFPRDGSRLTELLQEAVGISDGPTVLRFPGKLKDPDVPSIGKVGGADLLRRPADGTSPDVLLLGAGPMAATCLGAADRLTDQGIGVTVVDPRWVAPVDAAIAAEAARHRLVVTVEDTGLVGGFGDAVARLLREHEIDTPVRIFGLPKQFLEHGERAAILDAHGLTPQHLAREITAAVARRTPELAHRQDA